MMLRQTNHGDVRKLSAGRLMPLAGAALAAGQRRLTAQPMIRQ
jgi:hypothetical protein